ncbi:GIY-YIG nuclease family protein [Clostridium sp. K25]|uniref:GIY-YIG nuclease family protein n=1 Tax=Clostridium sp. K25 TaxID=1443109 RepID=UPI00069FA2C7|nr:GIY-YIG nuclease family protein [Clostridium sp. K25]
MPKKDELKVYGVIYKIENITNGRIYIGQTIQGFEKRYNNNILKYTHNEHLRRAIKKYGIDNFDINPCIDVAYSFDELNQKEKYFIQKYNSYLNGYNLTLGGEGVKGLPSVLHGMYGVRRYGADNPFYGKKHSMKTRKRVSEFAKTRVGNLNPNYGNGYKIKGYKNPMYGISPSERMDVDTYSKWKEQIKINVAGSKNPNASKVINITTGEIFDCIKDAKEIYGEIAISACCRGKCKTAGRCKWMYYIDYSNKKTRREVIV